MKKTIIPLLLFLFLLCGCASSEERAWQSGQKALAKEEFAEAAAAFERAGTFQDADKLLVYSESWMNLNDGNFTEADEGFLSLGDFKDSSLMEIYCRAREKEAVLEYSSPEDASVTVSCGLEAYTLFSNLSFFRDCDDRAAYCRGLLYDKASEWMDLGRYEEAAAGFEAIDDWQDSDKMETYCKASALEKEGFYTQAAELFSQIPDFMDSKIKTDSAQKQAYQLASELKEKGDYEAAADAFAALGSYSDSKEQENNAIMMLVRTHIQSGSYTDALKIFDRLEDPSVFPTADSAEKEQILSFLYGFMNVWMNSHAGVMNAFFSCNLLQPYLEPGGELDTLIHAELTDETAPQNYGFIFNGAEVKNMYLLDYGFSAAKVSGSASCFGPEGAIEKEEILWVLTDTTLGNPIAAAVLSVQE